MDVRKVLVLGSGAVKIAEAAEFDYSGSQALKAIKEEGVETVLVNPNAATIQTSYKFADKVYLVPLKPEFVAKVIELERPDGVLLGFGGQTALSLGIALHEQGVLSKYGVRVLGTPIEGIKRALSRGLFRKAMEEHGVPVPPSRAARSLREAVEGAEELGYPVMVRVSFNLGGAGSFVAWSRRELEARLKAAFAQSEVGEVLVEKYLHHWKEVEFEVVRDEYGDSAAIACMENVDPMGVHTGDSVVVAPCQTLTDYEYQLARSLSVKVAEAISLVGEGNVQVALNPRSSDEVYVIEVNPRMSRSSALASKATGYPLAYIAAKLALGYRLNEVLNKVTGRTTAYFEPSLDYVVVKMPRWDLEKFEGVDRSAGTEMKSVGEVMAIGRTFLEALQKAVRMLDVGEPGVVGGRMYEDPSVGVDVVIEKLVRREPYWPLWAAKAFKLGLSVDEVHELTGVDKYFLEQIREAAEFYEELRRSKPRPEELPSILAEAKRMGFSDEQLAKALGMSADEVRELRKKYGVEPVVKQVDTLAAEWPAQTNYLYLTYSGWEHDAVFESGKPKVLILGAGVFRVGVSVEFDWCVVNFADEARKMGYEVVVVNYNPETVSTDWDASDKLYFEEITAETVTSIYELEKPLGVVVSLGGQIANNIAWELERQGVAILGTRGSSVHVAESRHLFSKLLDDLGIKQPPWTAATSVEEALEFAEGVGYPVLVRPSYVLSGTAMRIAWSERELSEYLERAARVSPKYPVVVSKFIEGALEFEVDAVGDGRAAVGAVLEHVEPAGVHSGDATMVLPPRRLPWRAVRRACEVALELNKALQIRGPFNLQLLYKGGEVYVIELNLRASRSMPFTSKATGYNLMRAAAQAVLKGSVEGLEAGRFSLLWPSWFSVKSPQFSWSRLRGAYPYLGPEMRSVGEVAALGEVFEEAMILSWLSVAGNKLPGEGEAALVYTPTGRGRGELGEAAATLKSSGLEVLTIEGMEVPSLPKLGRGEALSFISRGAVGLVLTTDYAPEKDYEVRRAAADLAVPLVLHHATALELSRAIKYYTKCGGDLPVKDLKEFWKGLAVLTV